MITILTSILLTTINSEPLSFTNLPHTSLTQYRGPTSCNSAISGTFPANSNYTYHAYKLSELNGIGCTIFANLTTTNRNTTKRFSILIYTSNGELYGTSSASFTNKHQSTYYIIFDNSKSNSHSFPISYKYTLECTKKCNHKHIPRTRVRRIRRMQSSVLVHDDDAEDVSSGGGAVSDASAESEESSIGSFSDRNETFDSDSNDTSISFDSIDNSSVSASEESQESQESEEFVSDASIASISQESQESVDGNVVAVASDDSSDAAIVAVTVADDSSSGSTETTASTSTTITNNDGSSDDALFIGNDNEQVKTYDIIINFSKTAVENIWAVFLAFVAIGCVIAWCYYKRGYKKRKYVHDNLSSNYELP